MKTLTVAILFLFCSALGTNAQSWSFNTTFPGAYGSVRHSGISVTIGTKVYVGLGIAFTGSTNVFLKDLWEYETFSGVWTQMPDFPGAGRWDAIAFAIGDNLYVGGGDLTVKDMSSGLGAYTGNFFVFNTQTRVWNATTPLPEARGEAVSFTMNGKGYVSCGVGSGGVYFNDLLSFDPATAVWTRLAPLPGTTRRYPVGFSINGKGYVGGGYRGFWGLFDPTKPTYYFDFYEYSPTTNQWVSKTNVPSMSDDAVMSIAEGLYVSTCDKGYAIGGRKTNSASAFPTNKISIYNVINNTWSSFTNAQTASYKGAGWIVNGYLSVGLTGSASPGGEKIYFYELHQISMLPEICTTGQIALLTQPTNSSTSWVSNNTSALTISPNTGNSVTGYRMNGYNNEVTFTATMTSANGCSAIRTKSIWLGAPLIISQTLDGGTYYPGIGICPGNHYLNVTPKGGNASNAAWTVQAGVPYVTGTNTMNFTMNTSVTSIAITARSSNSCGQGANSSFYLSKKTFGCPSSFSLVIFPNPAEEDLTIEIVPDQSADNKGSEALVISDAVLVNMDGGIVATSGAAEGKTKLNVRGLKKGQYFLHVNVHGEIFKEQIVIR